jgi:hypothetical protein
MHGLWWIFPKTWVETLFIALGAFWFGKLWGHVTKLIEQHYETLP